MIGDRWGVTNDEVERRYPCDDVVPKPAMQAWRGVTVNAPPEMVWPWISQIRLAPYSYDWIDNLGKRSPRTLTGIAEPVAGQHFSTAATLRVGRILSVDTNIQLTGRIAGVVMSYVLVPERERTRLLLKLASSSGRLIAPALCLADLVMARRQLLNLKHLAEQPQTGLPGP
jgi:hypothetical protein